MSEYEARARQGREECLKKIRETDRKISAIYREAAKEMGAKAAGAKEGSLTKCWALDMQKSLTESSRRLGRDVLSEITSAVQEAAAIPGRVDGDWLRDAYAGAGGNLTGQTFHNMFTRTSDEALRMLLSGRAYLDGKSLSSRVWTQTGRLENGINQVIQQGIAQKKSAVQIARELEQYVNPDAHETIAQRRERVKSGAKLPFAGSIEYNCQRVARTSVNHAYFLAMKESAKLNPFCRAVHWELSGAHFERQVMPFGVDICDEYATHDEGLGVGNWPVDSTPLPHAQCLCSQWPEVPETLDECAGRLKSWLAGGEDAALDASYAAWKEALQSGMPDRRLGSIRDDAGEVRKGLLEKIAGRKNVKEADVSSREKLFERLNEKSTQEIESILHTLDNIKSDDTIVFDDSQFGKKNGKHAQEWGLNPRSAQDRQAFKELSRKIVQNSDDVRLVEWDVNPKTGRRDIDVIGFASGDDVVLLKPDGRFITTMKNGAISNERFKNGRRL